MKSFLLAIICLLKITISFSQTKNLTEEPTSLIKWYTWQEAMDLQKQNPKMLYVDLYTDWCGYCKKMDKETFTNLEVAKYINENFYPIKFNAEQKEDVVWKNSTFKFLQGGRRGTHQFAIALAGTQVGYPTFVAFTEDFKRIFVSPGYKEPNEVISELKFAIDKGYKNQTFEQFKSKTY